MCKIVTQILRKKVYNIFFTWQANSWAALVNTDTGTLADSTVAVGTSVADSNIAVAGMPDIAAAGSTVAADKPDIAVDTSADKPAGTVAAADTVAESERCFAGQQTTTSVP